MGLWTSRGRWMVAAAAALAVAAGCSSRERDVLARSGERLQEAGALADRVGRLPVTDAAALPRTGTARYDGFAALRLEPPASGPGGGASVVGRADLRADFGRNTIGGELNDFIGVVDGRPVTDFSGSLAVTEGRIARGAATGWQADVEGRLRGGRDRISVDGDLIGVFHTDGRRPAAAVSAITGPRTDLRLNGQRREGGIVVSAERPR